MKSSLVKYILVCLALVAMALFTAACTTPEPEDTRMELPEGAGAPPPPIVVPPPPQRDETDAAVEINLTEAPEPEASPWLNAEEMVAQMRVGWNLGNSLDAHPHGDAMRFDLPVSSHETMWRNPVTTQENIQTIAAAGFDVLRIPVTWYARMVIGCDNYTIRRDWMDRVIEIVNWGLEEDMFVILNTHHDEYIFSLWDDEMEGSKRAVARMWEQIGYIFRDYPHKLIFEGLNEPRTIGSDAEWNGGTEEERLNVNILNQLFVDTVREIGGNNTNRMLMVPTYAASSHARAVGDFVLPQDPTNEENKLIVSIHMYEPIPFALSNTNYRSGWSVYNPNDTGPVIWGLSRLYDTWVSQGIPVIMGEMGAQNRDNSVSRRDWTYFYVTEAMARGIVCVWWDNGNTGIATATTDHFGILNRTTNEFVFPEIVDALMEASARE